MSPLWRLGLWLWVGLLACVLCLAILPFFGGIRWLSVLLVVLLCTVGMWWSGREPDNESSEAELFELPSENYRLPIVLVCGDGLAALFGDSRVHQSTQGCWLRVDDVNTLQQFIRRLLWQRPEWAKQLAVMAAVNPQQHCDERELSTWLHELRWQLAQVQRDIRRSVPMLLSSAVASQVTNSPVWLSQRQAQPLTVWPTVNLPETLENWQCLAGNREHAQRLKQTVLFSNHNAWLQAQVLPALLTRSDDIAVVSPQQVILYQAIGLKDVVSSSLWQQWLVMHTELTQFASGHPESGSEDESQSFPEFIFSDLPLGNGVTSRRRALRRGVTLLTLAAIVALCSSAWQNRQLLHRVAFDVRHYYSVAMTDYVPKAQAVEILRQDAALLNNWFRNGEPLRLGLGLYQGERLCQPLLAAIKTYIPPPPPPVEETPKEPTAQAEVPKTVRLDSLSLFDVGKFQLKPNSTKMLVNALINIKAKPGWLIVVAGHTDITGNAQANQTLSLKRAEALRDWMLSTSDVSPTCFAVQGYGATHPIATNDTPEGRALNRRVEISLVPQANACLAAASQPSSGSDEGSTTSKEK